jgi:HEAT repeat protein
LLIVGSVLLGLSLSWPYGQAAHVEPAGAPAWGKAPRDALRMPSSLRAADAEAVIEPLGTMLLEGDTTEISVAAKQLGHIGSPSAIDALLVPLADPELSSRRHAAMAALEAMGEPAVGLLVALLDSEDATVRRNAAEMLGWIGSPSAVPALQALLSDGSAAVRSQAAWALVEIADRGAHEALTAIEPRSPAAN